MFAAEWGTGQVLWSILWFFLFVLWISLVFSVFADIIRSRSMSGFGKALWTIAIIFLPYLGVFLYLIVNGGKMNARAERAAGERDAAAQEYIRQAAGSNSADQLTALADLHTAGKLTDSEFASAKAQVTAG